MNEDVKKSGIREHHKKAITNLVNRIGQDADYLAVIIAGSVAKGIARDDSDIDCYLVVKDEIFQERKRRDHLFYYAEDGCEYEGGYYDGKMINYDFLKAAAEKGSEPTRASFDGAIVAFSRIPNLSELINRISIYPEANRERNFTDFYAQVELYGGYFAKRAITLNNTYLLSHAVSQVALFAGRLILAYNRILFPCHKSLLSTLERAIEKPASYVELQDAMLTKPNTETISAFIACIRSFHNWGITPNESISRFIVNNEWNWLDGEPPISDR
ncbi:hypothetical protein GC096_11085 [Paenibacillus sp. LMG 31461]|uniref:Polymerase nucleotidyl transferase domain-containing protein n=1 Tax=Paenibacillus plantarum TaxID=2654975 RepID=A0ABX1X867_9BACL|nr:nucleotidyltransferase domain-containing protein [Paenibacillus plantarum]NOU64574.1 hypothetical protein [Paenibacillus plantarum]